MARCNRQGIIYARHTYKAGRCKRCGTLQSEQLKALAQRRIERRALRDKRRIERTPATLLPIQLSDC